MPNPTAKSDAGRPQLIASPGACDTHIHIYGPEDEYPVRQAGAFPPPPSSGAADYQAVQERLGLERLVIVQPAAYGTDNRCTLDAMAVFGDQARGVAVVRPDISNEELTQLTDVGIRGLRFFMLPGGALSWDVLEPMAARVASFGWHIQLQMDGRHLHERVDTLSRLPVTLVIDHVGKFLEPVDTDHPGFLALLRLLEGGNCWVKLSAPYETSKAGSPFYPDVGKLAKVLVRMVPERLVWASNWPHPSVKEHNMPDDATLLDVLLDWVGDDLTRRRILVDNPAELYGFSKLSSFN
jgi:D-galactarolactone isomerase